MMNRCFGMTSAKAGVVALLCGVSALVTGCATSSLIGPVDNSPVTGATIQGNVHGGQQPIIGATVQLWAVGASGYGSAATALGSSVQTVGPSGTFTLGSYTCPSASTQTYITAQGGNPGLGGGANSNIMLAAALGNCGNLNSSTFIFMNEVTTAATAYALGQYFTPAVGGLSSADSFGAPNTAQAQTGIVNAMATVNNLVNVGTGNAVTSNTLTTTAGTITVTPESAKLNTLADILADCVNSAGGTAGDSSACGMLFSGVVTASGTAPTDTLQAAVYMSLNPNSANSNTDWPASTTCTTNVCVLFGLASAYQQFVGLSTQPNDWTLGIQYSAASTSSLLSEPLDLAADVSGNIWVINNPGSASDSLTELSPTGSPTFSSNLASGSATLASENPRNLAIDTAGDVWVASSSGSAYLFEYNPTSTAITTLNLGSGTYGLAIDGSNNVWVGKQSSGSSYTFNEFLGGTLAATNEVEYPVISPLLQPEYVAVDTSGNVWATEGSTSTAASTMLELSNINTSSCGAPPFGAACVVTSSNSANTYTTVSAGPLLEPFSLAAGPSGMWVANAGSSQNTVVELTGSGTSIAGTVYGSATSLNSPHYVAVDGVGNIWVANKDASSTIGGTVSELSSTGAVLSATTGEVGFAHTGLSAGEGIAVDPSGNVWIADDATSGTAGYSVFEMVGAAAPTVTPISLALKNSAVGKKP